MSEPQMDNVFRGLEELRQSLAKSHQTQEALQFGGGGGTSGSMDAVDAKIAAAEARTDTKFTQVLARLDNIEHSTRGTKTTVIVTAIAAVGVAVGVMAFGASQFGNGIMVTTAAVTDAAEAKRIAVENAAEVKGLREDFSAFVKAFDANRTPEQQSGGDTPDDTFQFAK